MISEVADGYGVLAQLGARLVRNEKVVGSSPIYSRIVTSLRNAISVFLSTLHQGNALFSVSF